MTKRPTVEASLRSRWLGHRLRELREDRGFVLKHIAEAMDVSFGDIKTAEHGLKLFNVSQVGRLLELYGIHDRYERDRLLSLARDAWRLHRWENHADVPPLSPSELDCLWLESNAQEIRCHSPGRVPDLLQLPDYAEAVVRRSASEPVFEPYVAWWRWAAGERQRALYDVPTLAAFRFVVAEAVLHRPVDDPDLTGRQLERMNQLAQLPHVTLQVLPASARYTPGHDSRFTVYELHPPYPMIATSHELGGPVMHEERHAELYDNAFGELSRLALDAATSAEVIAEAATQSAK